MITLELLEKHTIERWLLNGVSGCKLSDCHENTTSDLLWAIGAIYPQHIQICAKFADAAAELRAYLIELLVEVGL